METKKVLIKRLRKIVETAPIKVSNLVVDLKGWKFDNGVVICAVCSRKIHVRGFLNLGTSQRSLPIWDKPVVCDLEKTSIKEK